MIRKTEISNRDKYISKQENPDYEDHSDFYRRWYAKFGKPQTRTMPGDEFMQMLKEMIEFE